VLLDDGSTDATPSIVRDFGNVHYHHQDDMPLDEGRDRTALYKWALELKPDWIFTLDGDEVLAPEGAEQMVRATEQAPDDVNVYVMFMAIMASKNTRYTGPEPFAFWYMKRLFRVRDAVKEHEFKSKHDYNHHCGCVPEMTNEKRLRLNAWIKFYGYESPEAVKKKLDFYKETDPKHYQHLLMLIRGRVGLRRQVWAKSPDCREIGITKTVTYKGRT
jgi:glycosyltransferase involved in cell wall biosynthesis